MSKSSTSNNATDVVWESFKEIIRSLYLDKDLTLEDVKSEMEIAYQFFASKSQYELHFKKWDFRKYRTKEDWTAIAQKISKRKLEDKDSEVYFNGTLINPKKVRKETLRYGSVLGTTEMNFHAASPRMPEGITIKTPRAPSASPCLMPASITEHVTIGDGNDIFFGVNINDMYSGGFTSQIHPIDSPPLIAMSPCPENIVNDEIRLQHASMIRTPSFFEDFDFDRLYSINMGSRLMINLPLFRLQNLTEQLGFIPKSPRVNDIFNTSSQFDSAFSPLRSNRSNIALSERHRLLCGIVGSSSKGQVEAYVPEFITILQKLVPEKETGDISNKVQKLFDPSNKQPLYQLFEIVSYFSSNNMLSTTQTDMFLNWVIDQRNVDLLKSFLQIETPTTQAFTSRILESGIRVQNIEFLQILITSGVKFDNVLEEAVKIKDPQFLTFLLRSGVNPTSLSGVSGGRLLHRIARSKFTNIAQILIQHGADVNLPTSGTIYTTILHEAVSYSDIEMVKCLLDSGAFVDAFSRYEPYTALASAVYSSKIDIIIALLEKGADASTCSIYGQNIIEYSALKDRDVYEVLLQRADISGRPIPVGVILDVAEKGTQVFSNFLRENKARLPKRQLEMALSRSLSHSWLKAPLSLLDNGVDPNGPELDVCERPLMQVAYMDDMKYLKLLIRRGANIDLPGLLTYAAQNDDFEFFSLLIDEGADLEAYGPEALENAAENGSFEIVDLLLNRDVDVNAVSNNLTAFQIAAGRGDIEFAEYLIEMGADINAPASAVAGRTALQNAAEKGEIEMVAFLLDKNADVNAPPAVKAGRTVLEAAMSSWNPKETKMELFTLLLDHGALINRPRGQGKRETEILHVLVQEEEKDLIRLAMEAGADINRRSSGKYGQTALQLAARRGNMDIVKLLLEYGAEVNAPPAYEYGITALQAAASLTSPKIELVQLLIENGAEVNAKAGVTAGLTALQGAAIQGHIQIALFLLEMKAEVNARGAIKDGRTAIEGAAEHGRLDMVQILLNAGAKGDANGKSGFKRAIELAEKNRHDAIAQLLKAQENL